MNIQLTNLIDTFGDKEFTPEDLAAIMDTRYLGVNTNGLNFLRTQLEDLYHLGYLNMNGTFFSRNHTLDYSTTYNETAWGDCLRSKVETFLTWFKRTICYNLDEENIKKLENITINFSNEKKIKNSCGDDKEVIIKRIEQVMCEHLPSSVKKVLEEMKDAIINERNEYLDELLIDMQIEMYKHKEFFRTREYRGSFVHQNIKLIQIIRTINLARISYKVNGEFDANNFAITLYVENIKDEATELGEIFSSKLMEVFVHELFHAFHYLAVTSCGTNWVVDSSTEIAIESLASYVQQKFCIHYNINSADFLEDAWCKYDMYVYPYSGAKYIKWNVFNFCGRYSKIFNTYKIGHLINKNNNFTTADDLFNISLKDLHEAQQKLEICYSYEELIKNTLIGDTLRFASWEHLI